MEGMLVGLAFLLYFAVRGAVIDRPEAAYFHALNVVDLQRSLGIFWEADLNEWIMKREFWAQTANIVYFWLHFPLIIAFGIYLYYGQRSKYTLMRDAFLTSGAIALVIYWLYPVAPPRLLPELAKEFGDGGPIPSAGNFADARFIYKVKAVGTKLNYEIQAKAWLWYGGRSGSASIPRRLEPGMQVGFDIIADSRYGSLDSGDPGYDADFGMLSANLQTQKYIYAQNFQRWELKNYDGTNVPPECGDWGYLVSDIKRDADCEVTLADFDVMASEYWSCTDPCAPCGYDPF